MSKAIQFRAMLDQSDMLLSERLKGASNEMLALTYLALWNRMYEANSVSAPFDFIDKCGPALHGMAVLSLLRTLADELCRRQEEPQ